MYYVDQSVTHECLELEVTVLVTMTFCTLHVMKMNESVTNAHCIDHSISPGTVLELYYNNYYRKYNVLNIVN